MKQKISFILHAGLSAFVIYFCMYAFRKPFAAATFEGLVQWGWNFKIILVISQVLGYALSKFIGIRFVSSAGMKNKGFYIVLFIILAELALLGFALAPMRYKWLFLFLNGIPLGMIWGLVFAYLEGRTTTELLAAMLSSSYIIASGATKSVGKWLMNRYSISEFWMPFTTGALFLLPLLLAVWWIQKIPPPTQIDIQFRKKREPMTAADRRKLFWSLAPGLIALILMHFFMTAFRDLRDNFAAELWQQLGFGDSAAVFTTTEIWITVAILVILSFFILIKNNLSALLILFIVMALGMVILLFSTFLFQQNHLSPFLWMTFTGLGVYMAYVPMGSMVFERISAIFQWKSNAGFLIYVADAFSYLGSVGILLIKEIVYPSLSVYDYFNSAIVCDWIGWIGLYTLGLTGILRTKLDHHDEWMNGCVDEWMTLVVIDVSTATQ